MAMRRSRIKAIANLSASRGRSTAKPQLNEKVDENTPTNQETTTPITKIGQLPRTDETKEDGVQDPSDKPVNDNLVETLPSVVRPTDISAPTIVDNTDSNLEASNNCSRTDTVLGRTGSENIEKSCSEISLSSLHTSAPNKTSQSSGVLCSRNDVQETNQDSYQENGTSKMSASYSDTPDSSVTVQETLVFHYPEMPTNKNASIREPDNCNHSVNLSNVSNFAENSANINEEEALAVCPTSVTRAQNDVNTETGSANVQNRLSRKRIKPLICLSSMNRRVRDKPKGVLDNAEEKASECAGQQTNSGNIPVVEANNKVADLKGNTSNEEDMMIESNFENNEEERSHVQTCEFELSTFSINSPSKSATVGNANEDAASAVIPKTSFALIQNVGPETISSSVQNKLSRKCIKPSICASLVNREVTEKPKGIQDKIEEKTSECLELQKRAENIPFVQTNNEVTGLKCDVSDRELRKTESNEDEKGHVQTHESEVSACSIKSSSKPTSVVNVNEVMASAVIPKTSVALTKNVGPETSSSTIQNRLSRKRIKPSICASLVNRKVRDGLKGSRDKVEEKISEFVEQQTYAENIPFRQTNNEVADLKDDASDGELRKSASNCKDTGMEKDHEQTPDFEGLAYSINSSSKPTLVVNVNEDVASTGILKTSVAVRENISPETSSSCVQNRFSRKRFKPSICASLVNRKVREGLKGDHDKVEEKTSDSLEQQTHAENIPFVQTTNEIADLKGDLSDGELGATARNFKDIEEERVHEQSSEFEVLTCNIDSSSKPVPVNANEDVTSSGIPNTSVAVTLNISQETSSSSLQNRFSRKRIKPTICASSVNKKVREGPKGGHDKVEEKTSDSLEQQTHARTNNEVAGLKGDVLDVKLKKMDKKMDSNFKDNEEEGDLEQTPELEVSAYSIHSSSTPSSVVNTNEDVASAEIPETSVTVTQNVSPGTSLSFVQNRLSRKCIEPSVSASVANRKVREGPIVVHDKVEEKTSDNLEQQTYTENIPILQTNNEVSDLKDDVSDEEHRSTERNFKNNKEDRGHEQTHEFEASTCSISFTRQSTPVINDNEDMTSCRMPTASVLLSQNVSPETSSSSVQSRLSRKRIKPSVCTSLVNRKVREGPKGVHDKFEEKTSECLGQQTPGNITVLQTNNKVPDSKVDMPNRERRGSGSKFKNNGDKRAHVKLCDFGMSACGVKLPNKSTPVVVTPTVKTDVSTEVSTSDYQSEEPIKNLQGKCASDNCLPSETAVSKSDCGAGNLFRSRFIKPKPRILDVASRRSSRSISVESASESDGEKKSLSSVSTASPPFKPQILRSRNRLNPTVATEKLSQRNIRRSGSNTDESDDNGVISDASTEILPKKRVELNSDGDSDFSQTELSKGATLQEKSPPKKKTRRGEYVRRLIEIKKEISTKLTDGKINKSRLTMFDLIYYNPVTNPMKSVTETSVTKTAEPKSNSSESEIRLAEESIDEPEEEDRSSSMPVPQVKVGPNGEIILDEQSLVIETTDAQKNWNDLQNSEVIMDYGNGTTTFNAYSKKKRKRVNFWNKQETLRFYRALHTVGTDFLLMQTLFPKLTRNELKNRFKKEEKENKDLVEKALKNPLTFDLTALKKEFETEREEEENAPPPPRKKRVYENYRNTSLAGALDSTDKGKKRIRKTRAKREKDNTQKAKTKKRKGTVDETLVETNSESEAVLDNNTHAEDDSDNEKAGDQETATLSAQTNVDCDSGKIANKEPATATGEVEARRSVRTRRPRIFEDFMTDDFDDDLDDMCEYNKVTEIRKKVTVKDICHRVTVKDDSDNDSDSDDDRLHIVEDEPEVCENSVDANDANVPESESEEEDGIEHNITVAEEGLTVHENGVTLGNVYSNVKPGTLIVLASENPDNPGHKIFRVFMVSNNSQTVPVSVSNSDISVPDDNSTKEEISGNEPASAANSDKVGCSNFKVS